MNEARFIVKTTDGQIHQSQWSTELYDGREEVEEKVNAEGLKDITLPGGTVRKFNGAHIIYMEIESR